jgi:hypothetical protein
MDSLFQMKDAALVFTAIMAGLCVIVVGVAAHWRKLRHAEIDGALKQEMIQRGMSADEITRILQATSVRRTEGKQADSQQ